MKLTQNNPLNNETNSIPLSVSGQAQMIKDALYLTVQNKINEVLEVLVRGSAICIKGLNHELLKNKAIAKFFDVRS